MRSNDNRWIIPYGSAFKSFPNREIPLRMRISKSYKKKNHDGFHAEGVDPSKDVTCVGVCQSHSLFSAHLTKRNPTCLLFSSLLICVALRVNGDPRHTSFPWIPHARRMGTPFPLLDWLACEFFFFHPIIIIAVTCICMCIIWFYLPRCRLHFYLVSMNQSLMTPLV